MSQSRLTCTPLPALWPAQRGAAVHGPAKWRGMACRLIVLTWQFRRCWAWRSPGWQVADARRREEVYGQVATRGARLAGDRLAKAWRQTGWHGRLIEARARKRPRGAGTCSMCIN